MKKLKQYVKRNKSKIIIFLAILPVFVCGLFFYSLYQVYNFVENHDNQIAKDNWEIGYMQGQVDTDANYTQAQKDDLLKKLAFLESSNGKYRKILDTNNKYSMGLYHFQADTVKDMYKRYFHQTISTEQAVNIAMDDERSTQLAECAIFVHNEAFHWKNSMIKLKNIGINIYDK